MPPRRASPLSGLMGALVFLVLVQAFELLVALRIDWAVKFGVALAVGVSSAVLAPAVGRWVRRRNGQL